MAAATPSTRRWRARPVASVAVRVLSFLLPIGASVVAAAVLTRVLPRPTAPWPLAGWVATVLVGSTIVLLVVELLARRLLPLSALLRMTMLFPDTAPSRYRVARTAGRVTDIAEQVRRARQQGLSDEPITAAEELLTLIAALSRHDRATRGHAERTRVFVDMLADELELPQEDRDRLRWAALLHDIGKLHVPSKVLTKPDRPSANEWSQLRRHPEHGMYIASALHEFLGPWAETIRDHHERWDGTGYPNGRAGTDISLGGRIVAVADAFEVMTAARPYKSPMQADEARRELTASAGSQFDPTIVRAFLAISLGRLRWTIGPLSWLAQSPFLLRTGSRVVEAGAAVARGTAAVAVGGATAVSGVVPAVQPVLARWAEPGDVDDTEQVDTPPAESESPEESGDGAAARPPDVQAWNSSAGAPSPADGVQVVAEVASSRGQRDDEPSVTDPTTTDTDPDAADPASEAPGTPPVDDAVSAQPSTDPATPAPAGRSTTDDAVRVPGGDEGRDAGGDDSPGRSGDAAARQNGRSPGRSGDAAARQNGRSPGRSGDAAARGGSPGRADGAAPGGVAVGVRDDDARGNGHRGNGNGNGNRGNGNRGNGNENGNRGNGGGNGNRGGNGNGRGG